MDQPMERRPGVAYRRPDGDPNRFVVEAAGDPRLDAEALPESDWLEAMAEDDRDKLRSALETSQVDVTYRLCIDGDSVWVRECGRRDDSDDVVGYLFPASERVERQRRLAQQRERLEEFASVVSHDLRNPLSVAVGNVELAQMSEGEAVDERLDRAHDALSWMDDLISDLLALAREGRSVEKTADTDLRPIVDEAWRTAGGPPEVDLVVEEPLPTVDCDRRRLREALENLFRNAIEHGITDDETADGISPGTITRPAADDDEVGDAGDPATDHRTAAEGDARDSADPALRVYVGNLDDGFYVADDGPGIAPAERESVFEPGHTTADDGTGFGLSIVERIAEAHGWEVSVTDSRDGGARFEFRGVDRGDEARSTDEDRSDDGVESRDSTAE